MSRRKLLLLVCLILNAVLVAVALWRHEVSRASATDAASPPPTPQQKRVNDFISLAVDLASFEEAVKSLDTDESPAVSMALTSAAMESSDPSPELSFNVVLADRRVARVFGYLQSLPADEARIQCLAVFKTKLANLHNAWKGTAKFFKESAIPVMSRDLHQRYHPVAAAVVLGIAFCRADDVVEMCDEWDHQMRSALRESEFDPAAYTRATGVPFVDVFPEKLFLLNVYASLLDRHGCESIQSAADAAKISLPPASDAAMMKWNAQPHSKKPAASDELMRVPFFRGWGGVFPGAGREKAVACARRAVDQCRAKPGR